MDDSSEDHTHCPIRTIFHYVDHTKNLRQDKKFLFISYKKGHKKYEIAKTSLAHYNQLPLDQILEACKWSNHNTFTSFYLQNIFEVNKKDVV